MADIVQTSSLPATPMGVSEKWRVVGTRRFGFLVSLTRSQGLDFDGARWWFSSNYTLSATGPDMESSASLFLRKAIPPEVSSAGGNHIGDIACLNGKVYTAIEDGRKYEHPYIVVFDGSSGKVERIAKLPPELHKKGVPWVAADGARRCLYTAEYDRATRINVFDIDTFALRGFVELQSPICSVQGGKVHDGALYVSCDEDPNGVRRIDLDTGAVSRVAEVTLDPVEVEGLAFRTMPDGQVHLFVSMITERDRPWWRRLLFARVAVQEFEPAT